MLVVTRHVTQAANDVRELDPTPAQIANLPDALGEVGTLLGDTGYCSRENIKACDDAGVDGLISTRRETHHVPVMTRFAEDMAPPETDDVLVDLAHTLSTRAGRAAYALRKQTVEPVFGIIKQAMGWRGELNARPVSGQALRYALVRRASLKVLLANPDVAIDGNHMEP